MKKKLVVLAGVLTFTSVMSFAWAGGVGNGGVSVVCRDAQKKIISAEVLDLYEGSVCYGKKYNNVLDAETKIELAQLKLAKNPHLLARFQDELANVRTIMHFIPKGNSLTPTNDAFPKIIKDGCNFEQLANYTNDGELLISQEIYDELDEVNKAALFVHETIYANFREDGDEDSQRARKLTAEMLAANADQKVIDQMINVSTQPNSQSKKVCGTKGTVEERIRHCRSTNGGFALVSRTKEMKEVHKDLRTGLLWGDRLASTMNHYNAEKACNASLAEVAGISNSATWRLPYKEEYEEAEKNGIRKALPNMNYWFWSSTVRRNNSDFAWLFNGNNGVTDNYFRTNESVSVRCVAR